MYGLKQKKMFEMFDCTLELFANKFFSAENNRSNECTFKNISKYNVDSYLEYISNDNGKGILKSNEFISAHYN